jgi:hypothetical protein
MSKEEDWVQPEDETEWQLLAEWEEWVRSHPTPPTQGDGQSCPN